MFFHFKFFFIQKNKIKSNHSNAVNSIACQDVGSSLLYSTIKLNNITIITITIMYVYIYAFYNSKCKLNFGDEKVTQKKHSRTANADANANDNDCNKKKSTRFNLAFERTKIKLNNK